MAQQFAHQHYDMCRRLVLAATSPGALMVPGDPRVLWKMATPRRYVEKEYMRRIAPEIYGGAFRLDPKLIANYAEGMAGASGRGYLYQVLAMTGWTSLPWLWTLKQPTLILAGSDDPIVPLINARVMARLMPNARLEILDEGHLFLVTRPIEIGGDHREVLGGMRETAMTQAFIRDPRCLNSLFRNRSTRWKGTRRFELGDGGSGADRPVR